MNISPSNISPNMGLDKRFHQNHQAVLAAMSINGLNILSERYHQGLNQAFKMPVQNSNFKSLPVQI